MKLRGLYPSVRCSRHARSGHSSRTRPVVATLAAAVILFSAARTEAQVTWSGTGADANWGTTGNWSSPLTTNFNTGLVFAGSNLLSNTNTLSGGTATSITFASGAGAFSLSGSSINLAGTITNSSTEIQTINLGITLSGNRTVQGTSGTVVFNGPISGTGGLTGNPSAGQGLVLRLTSSNSYSGNTSFARSGGLQLGHAYALGSGTLQVTGANSSGLVITNVTGGDLTINNNFSNAGRPTFSSTTGLLTIGGTTIAGGAVASTFIKLSGSSQVAFETLAAANATSGFDFQGFGADSRLTIKNAAQPSLVADSNVNAPLALGSGRALGSGAINLYGSADIMPLVDLTGTNAIQNAINLKPTGASYGTLRVSGSNNMTVTGPVTVATDFGRGIQNISSGRLVLEGNVYLSDTSTTGRTLRVVGSGNTTISGTIADFNGIGASSGTVAFGVSGAEHTGSTTISGSNTYSGGTFLNTQNTGTVILGHNAALGSGRVEFSGGSIHAAIGLDNVANAFLLNGNATFGGTNGITLSGGLTGTAADRTLSNQISGGQLLTLAGTTSIRAGTDTTSRVFTVAGSGNTVLSGPIVNGGGASGDGGVTITNTGTTTLSGTNTYTGATTVSNGIALLSTTAAISGTAARPYTVNAAGTLAAGYALDQALLNKVGTTSAGAVALGANSSENLNFSTAGLTAASLGAVGTGTWAYSGTLTPNGTVSSGTYRLGGGGGTLDFQSALTGSNALVVGGDVTGLGGTVILSNTANSFSGATTVQRGNLRISSLTNAGSNSSTGTNGTINLSSGTSVGTLQYVGSGNTSNRTINIQGTVGGTVDARGSGALDMTSGTISAAAGTTVWLTGTSTADNAIGFIASGSNVIKTGPGRWQLSGLSTYNGQLQVLDGTVVVASTVATAGNPSPFGSPNSNVLPIVGDSASGITGTAAMLAIGGIEVNRGLAIATLGPGSSQVAVLGMTGTGTAIFGSSRVISVARDLTLQASNNGTAEFNSTWAGASGTAGPGPAVVFTVGSANNAGTVRFGSNLPSSLTGVTVANGTAQMNNSDDIISSVTPVTVGSTLGAATLDLNGRSQSLSRLTFAGNSGSVTTGTAAGGRLRLVDSGSVSASGTGHMISAAMALDDDASFNVVSGGRLRVSGEIATGSAGAKSLTKSGLGTLELSGTNTYAGATLVAAGSLLVNGRLTATAVTVQSGGLLGGSGTFDAGISVLAGGTLSPGNSPGLIAASDLSLAGTTLMEIDGLSPRGGIGGYDAIDVTGLLTYGGSMVIDFGSLITNALPNGTEFDLFAFSSGSSTGSFSSITTVSDGSWYGNLTFTNSGGTWTAQKDSQRLEFTQSTGNLVIVPEPAAIAIAGAGIAAAAWAARRRRS